jgi:KaiC/GvpD/RAD55 family RecA-like ATPase
MKQSRNLSTGIGKIDKKLNGGFLPGSIVCLLTKPNTPSHAVLQQAMRQRPTVYISTLRPASVVKNELTKGINQGADVRVEEVGDAAIEHKMLHELTDSKIHAANTTDPDRVFDEVYEIVRDIDEHQNVIIDPMNPLERNTSRVDYKNLLSQLARILLNASSIGVFHCMTLGDPPAYRETTLTAADVVWEFDTVTNKNDDLKVQTKIPKNRGGDAILEKIDLIINESSVSADQSRSI